MVLNKFFTFLQGNIYNIIVFWKCKKQIYQNVTNNIITIKTTRVAMYG